ncbi:hypothetical protein AVEN_83003-1 [Araneus ventricosus]|uniref:Uncharacterized protein n=1 Tax=Araneus ventricosus TaxID=182803 RepID=A0A4Y2GQJ9_ARAVE|nr:hypothetical protein AVEN_83003-1 [Araneus ventricosus]
MRRKGGSNDHPTPVDFLQRTRMLLAEGMFVMCGNVNCEPDQDIILESIQIIPQTDEDCLELVIDESATIMDCPEAQENWDDLEHNSAAYVAGYILKNLIRKSTVNSANQIYAKSNSFHLPTEVARECDHQWLESTPKSTLEPHSRSERNPISHHHGWVFCEVR